MPHRVAVDEAARDGRVRKRALEIYAEAARDWEKAPGAIGRGIRGARELRSHERRFVSEAVFGMVRGRRRLAFSALALDDAEPRVLYLAWLREELGGSPALDGELAAAGVDVAALAGAPARIAQIASPVARLGVAQSIPDWLAERLVRELGDERAERVLAAMNRRAPLTIRANRLKVDRDALIARLAQEKVGAQPHPLAPDALLLDTHLNAYGLASFKEGLFELQDAGSQLIAEVCAPPPRGLVVDACAGAGGKTLALGALLGNRGRLVALDASARKLEELRDRARRAGLTNTRAVAVKDGQEAESFGDLVGRAERVLCDVPCSGIGVLRRNPEARWRLEPADLDELPRVQRRLLDTYASLVAPGGRLIYATCTILRAENDEVADGFLAAHDSFEPVLLKEILGGERAGAIGDGARLRLSPDMHDTDGFFAAVLRRRS